jgi:hypothetical protein
VEKIQRQDPREVDEKRRNMFQKISEQKLNEISEHTPPMSLNFIPK